VTNSAPENTSWKFLFDGTCALCKKFAGMIDRAGTRVVPVELHAYLQSGNNNTNLTIEALESVLHLISPQGEILTGHEAVQKILLLIPALRPFRWMLSKKAGSFGIKAAYYTADIIRKRCRSCKKK